MRTKPETTQFAFSFSNAPITDEVKEIKRQNQYTTEWRRVILPHPPAEYQPFRLFPHQTPTPNPARQTGYK
ncbi:MAG: hypothetical protein MPK30_02865, partial [Gammaproteobacteria bacterium]|nr:hypothetical protein [Gammaproteobacteria bacterium]